MGPIKFGNLDIEVVDAEGSTERSIEFGYINDSGERVSVAVVVPDDGDWSSAVFCIDPQGGDVSAAVAARVIEVARQIIEAD